MNDAYPFQLTAAVKGKLHFVHMAILNFRQARARFGDCRRASPTAPGPKKTLRAHKAEIGVGIAIVRDKAQLRLDVGDRPVLQILRDNEAKQRTAQAVGILPALSASATAAAK